MNLYLMSVTKWAFHQPYTLDPVKYDIHEDVLSGIPFLYFYEGENERQDYFYILRKEVIVHDDYKYWKKNKALQYLQLDENYQKDLVAIYSDPLYIAAKDYSDVRKWFMENADIIEIEEDYD